LSHGEHGLTQIQLFVGRISTTILAVAEASRWSDFFAPQRLHL
jgi:hypothetical protein